MSNQDTIQYSKIEDRDIRSLLSTGNNTANAEVNLTNNQGKLWGNLLGNLETKISWSSLENMSQKEIRVAIQKELKTEIEQSDVKLLKNDKGKVLWSKDKHTKGIMKYTSDIAKIVHSGLANEMLPGDGTYAARCDILKACVSTKSALELIKLAISQIDNAMNKAEETEYAGILEVFQTLSVHVAKVTGV